MSTSAATSKIVELPADVAKLSPAQGRKLVNLAGALAALGVIACIAAALVDSHRFAFSYLVGFVFVVTIGLGAIFFVIIHHLSKAGWSVAARRHMEWVSAILPVGLLLFVPVALMGGTIYHHWMGPEAAHDPLLIKKASWLNPTFFYIRAVVYFAVWIGLWRYFTSRSSKQDVSGDPELTRRMQVGAAPAVAGFALSLTFAGFDWLMSLDPHWYSTIFGVYVFAGSLSSSVAVLALITIALHRAGLLHRVSNVEHRHDIGKFLFSWVIFHAYIGFSQFLLIWYANIPEETIFYRHRWEGSWKAISLLLFLGHFVLPFIMLISRTAKRSMSGLAAGAIVLLVMHYVDLYWLVMPTHDIHGVHPSWIDLAGLLGPLGILGLVVATRVAKGPLYPLKDPRLAETVKVVNL